MECQRCYREVTGAQAETGWPLSRDVGAAPVESTSPDRDWIECQACSKIICFQCCRQPQSGFCDDCIAGLNLTAELTGLGLVGEESL